MRSQNYNGLVEFVYTVVFFVLAAMAIAGVPWSWWLLGGGLLLGAFALHAWVSLHRTADELCDIFLGAHRR